MKKSNVTIHLPRFRNQKPDPDAVKAANGVANGHAAGDEKASSKEEEGTFLYKDRPFLVLVHF